MIEVIRRLVGRFGARVSTATRADAADSTVRRIDRAPSGYEVLILRHLRHDTGAGLAAIVDRVVEEVVREEQAHGAWNVDIGVWGRAIVRRDVLATVQGMLGRSLALEGDVDGPWYVVPAQAS
jgi:hypothetical protein